MIPIRLELHNFLAYRQPDPLNLDGIHTACISGENGAGKSSLLDAITWALWGRARSSSPDDLIYQGEREMRVALVFELAGVRYQVIRQRRTEGKTGTSLLDLQVFDPQAQLWRSLGEHTLRQTQEKISSLLRLDYETFLNSAYLAQGRADEFTAKPPFQRVQILATILGLDQWQTWEEAAKEQLRRSRETVAQRESRLEEIRAELERRAEYLGELSAAAGQAEEVSRHLGDLERAWAAVEQTRHLQLDLERQLTEATRRLRADRGELEEAVRELEDLRRRADTRTLAGQEASLLQQREMLAGSRTGVEELAARRQALAEQAGALRGENETLVPQSEPIKRRIETLQAAQAPLCPTCGQPLTEDHRHSILQELQTELDSRRERYRENQAHLRELTKELDAVQSQLVALQGQMSTLPAVERRLAETEAALQAASEAGAKMAGAQARVERWQQTLAQDEQARARMEQGRADFAAGLQEADALRASLEQTRLEKRLADERVGGTRQKLAALEALERQREALQADLLAERERISLLEVLREAFGKRGIPTMIIDTVVPEVEEVANALLGRMTAGQMNLRLETSAETKTGEARDTLDIIISDQLGTRAYEMYSGGEAFRINFALRVALSKLLARRAGAQLRTLFIDEGFGSQDTLGRERLVAAINSIQDDFDRILVITHLDELREAFSARIEVTKTPEGSQLRVV